eukprot:1228394-Pleurochrysis_carterae.AAC.1
MRQRFDSEIDSKRAKHALRFARTRAPPSLFLYRAFFEQFERVSLGQHHSKYPHAVQFKAVAQILEVGDLWNFSLSALESYHAEVGR